MVDDVLKHRKFDAKSDQKNGPNANYIGKTKWFKWFLGAIILVVVSIVVFLLVMKGLPWDMSKRGQLGDMFGVVGALFSGLAFAGVVVTMLQQNEDLNLQRKELALQRKEIEQTNRELELQRAEMQEQNRTIMLQRFENTFFGMLKMQQKIVEGFVCTISNGRERFKASGKEAIKVLYNNIYELCKQNSIESIEQCLEYYYELEDGKLDHYFRHLYRIVRFVDDYDSHLLDDKGKYIYLSLLRAQLSKEELLMLFYNCLSEYGNEKFKPLVEKYALLKNYRQDSLINPEHAKLYKKGAFEFGAQEEKTDNDSSFDFL